MAWHPTLGSIERRTDNPWQRRHPPADSQHQESRLPVIAMNGCWCGLQSNHEFTGKDEGQPHPRYTPEEISRLLAEEQGQPGT
jgi:hypothetical protein